VLAERASLGLAAELAAGLAGSPGAHRSAPPVLDVGPLVARGPGPERVRVHDAAARAYPAAAVQPTDVACILYTSGSTGQPKGVVQTHRNLLHNAAKLTRSQALTAADRLTLLGNTVYAASMSDLFGALLNGASLHPYDVRRQGVDGLPGWVIAEGITVFASVPTLFRHATAALDASLVFPDVRLVKLAGEPVQRRDLDHFRRHFRPPCRFLNSLGATEINTIRQHFLEHASSLDGELVPVGHAVEGTEILILDEAGRVLGPEREGEIAVRSEFLSPGYWGAPELTARAFTQDPEGSARRVFRTGDLGRLSADGCLAHLGRRDGQVRIRGHRVETAEVEAALLLCADLRAAAVVAREGAGGDTELIAWLVSRSKQPPTPAALRAALAGVLPDAMLPARFVFRAALPLLATGKVDRRALAEQAPPPETGPARPPADASAAPSAVAVAAAAAAADAVKPEERRLIAIWERTLRLSCIGRDDDFFELGGHSLVAARIVARIHRQLGVVLPLTVFREAPTVARLSAHIAARGAGDAVEAADPLVVLQEGGELLPIFCVPGAGSDAFSLLELARALGPEQPVVALQIPGLHPGERPQADVEPLAARLVERLRAHRPHGPYALGGASFGGIVAFAMAQALRAAGEDVALLALFDTGAPGFPRARRGLSPAAWPRLAARWVLPRGAKEQRSLRYVKRGLREKFERLRFGAHRALHGAGAPLPFAWRFTYLRELCFRAQDRYRPAPWPGALHLFRNVHQPPADLYESVHDLGWGPLVTGTLAVHDVPGRHGEELAAPHVQGVARALGDVLGDALGDAHSACARGAPAPVAR
jgi:acyl-coenzyme A synthetase/AMP-(fatty) acid ligase/thioesterase domain-containing protein/acyl carrier protein